MKELVGGIEKWTLYVEGEEPARSVKAWNVSLDDIYMISAVFSNQRFVRFGHDAKAVGDKCIK